MKNLICIIIIFFGFLFNVHSVGAQNQILDKIILKDSTVIEAKIKKVMDEHLIYEKADKNGVKSIFQIRKDQITKIEYATLVVGNIAQNNPLPPDNHIEYNKNIEPWLKNEFNNSVSLYDQKILQLANDYFKKELHDQQIRTVLAGGLGGAMAITGVVLLSTNNQNSNRNNPVGSILAGTTLLITGTTLGVLGTTFGIHKINRYKKSSQIVRQELNKRGISITQLKLYPSINLKNKALGIRVAFHF